MLKFLMGTDDSFFQSFEAATQNLKDAAQTLHQTFASYPQNIEQNAARMKDLEHKGDQITHETMDKLNKTFITPFDREDIHNLISRLDDILDLMDGAVNRLSLYRISSVTKEAVAFGGVLIQATHVLHEAVTGLRDMKKPEIIVPKCHEVHTFENEGDLLLRQAMVNLFESEKSDPINVIKWKEIYEDLEAATDRCEDVANVVEGIVLKNG